MANTETQYRDSAEFTNDMTSVAQHLEAAKELLANVKYKNWIKDTDYNYMTRQFQTHHENLIQSLEDTITKNNLLMEILDNAG